MLNRLVRSRMLGGVGGVPGNRAPIPIAMVTRHYEFIIGGRQLWVRPNQQNDQPGARLV